MSLLSRPAFAAMNTADLRLIGSVSFAHFISHINMMILPPLFAIVREDFNVSYFDAPRRPAASAQRKTPGFGIAFSFLQSIPNFVRSTFHSPLSQPSVVLPREMQI